MTQWKYCPECAKPLQSKQLNQTDRPRLVCPDGHYVHYRNPIPTCIGLVEYQGKYLILKRADDPQSGWWDLPGGFIEEDESAEESLVRELEEETGLKITVQRPIGAFKSSYGDDGRVICGIAFEATADSAHVKLSEENSAYEWRTLDDMPELAFKDVNAAVVKLRDQG